MQYEIATTSEFDRWYDDLRDDRAITAVRRNIVKLLGGLFGNAKPVGDGISKLKIDIGAGYRVYFVRRGRTIIVLLTGGDKSSQRRVSPEPRRWPPISTDETMIIVSSPWRDM